MRTKKAVWKAKSDGFAVTGWHRYPRSTRWTNSTIVSAPGRLRIVARIADRSRTIGEDFAAEQPLLNPLPDEAFDPGLALTPSVDRSALITVRMPVRSIGRKARVSLRANHVVICDGSTTVALHPRVTVRGGCSVLLDHYLEVLKTKSGAPPGPMALARAREAGTFTTTHEVFWAVARRVNGNSTNGAPLSCYFRCSPSGKRRMPSRLRATNPSPAGPKPSSTQAIARPPSKPALTPTALPTPDRT